MCVYLSSFLFSLHRHEISGHCLSVLTKCKLSEGRSKGYWSPNPTPPPLTVSFGLTSHFCPTLTVLCGLKGGVMSLPCPPPTSLHPFTLLLGFPRTHTLLSFSSYVCQSSHSHCSNETALPLVCTETMISDKHRLCGGQKSKASSFASLNHEPLTTVNKHTRAPEDTVMSVFFVGPLVLQKSFVIVTWKCLPAVLQVFVNLLYFYSKC